MVIVFYYQNQLRQQFVPEEMLKQIHKIIQAFKFFLFLSFHSLYKYFASCLFLRITGRK